MTAYSWPFTLLTGGYRLGSAARRAESIAESHFLPPGAYTTMRTIGGTGVLRWHQHLDRLAESTQLMGRSQEIPRDALQSLLCRLLRDLPWAGIQESRVRLTITTEGEPVHWVSVEPLIVPPDEAYGQGVAVLVRPMARANPRAKDARFIEQSASLRALRTGGIEEVLMVGPDGALLEGIDSNFFAVRDGVLRTAEVGVLPGVTRRLVLEEAERASLPVKRDAVPEAALSELDEAFISSTTRGILPVATIEGRPVGDGQPGPVTTCLMARYQDRIRAEATELCQRSNEQNSAELIDNQGGRE